MRLCSSLPANRSVCARRAREEEVCRSRWTEHPPGGDFHLAISGDFEMAIDSAEETLGRLQRRGLCTCPRTRAWEIVGAGVKASLRRALRGLDGLLGGSQPRKEDTRPPIRSHVAVGIHRREDVPGRNVWLRVLGLVGAVLEAWWRRRAEAWSGGDGATGLAPAPPLRCLRPPEPALRPG